MLKSLIDLYRLNKNQWRSSEDLAALQLDRLRTVVQHAYDKVLVYRRRFDDAGFHPDQLQGLDDLRRIPTITRRELQSLPLEDIIASGVAPAACQTLTTAGSSGMPLTVYVRPQDDRMKDMVWARTSLACGKRLTDITVYFKYQSAPPQWYERLGLWRRLTLSVLDPAEERVRIMQQASPQVLRGNAFELLNTANAALEMGVNDIRLRAVFSMGSLLDDVARERISQAFRCDVFDFYGATELGCIAWECPEHRGLHINVDNVVVEFLDSDDRPVAPGESGRIVCTSLNFFAMPFIRYEIGDVGVLGESPCSCGRGLPLMTRLMGGRTIFLYDPMAAPSRRRLL